MTGRVRHLPEGQAVFGYDKLTGDFEMWLKGPMLIVVLLERVPGDTYASRVMTPHGVLLVGHDQLISRTSEVDR